MTEQFLLAGCALSQRKLGFSLRILWVHPRRRSLLITTLSPERLSAADLPREYQGQTSVERHFHFVKDPWFVDGWFLKKAERLEASEYVILLACLLHSLLERRLRRSAATIPSPSRRILKHPTTHEVVRHLESLQIVADAAGARHIAMDPLFHPTLEAICTALGMAETVFTTPPSPITTSFNPQTKLMQLPTFRCKTQGVTRDQRGCRRGRTATLRRWKAMPRCWSDYRPRRFRRGHHEVPHIMIASIWC